MYSLILEITTPHKSDFYNPADSLTRAYPRTMSGVKKATNRLIKWVRENNDLVISARILVYSGKYEYYNKMEPVSAHKVA